MVEAGVIRQNTEIEAYYSGVDMAGCPFARTVGVFTVNGVRVKEGTAEFVSQNTKGGPPRAIPAEDIVRLDGMEIDRVANIYGFDLSGGKLKQGRRRGRKPKNREVANG